MAAHTFRFRTLNEATEIARHLSSFYPDSNQVFYGLNELMINAVEHGNLGVGYEKKTQLVRQGLWRQEVERRLNIAENRNKYATATLEATPSQIVVNIKDTGSGFDWRPYLSRHRRPAGRPAWPRHRHRAHALFPRYGISRQRQRGCLPLFPENGA